MISLARPKNVLGSELQTCSKSPLTGFFRTGCCETGPEDHGVHVVCSVMTADFLEYSRAQGNDLSTPRPGFAGLAPGDRWCLCAERWKEAFVAGKAPGVVLEATHHRALDYVALEDLQRHQA